MIEEKLFWIIVIFCIIGAMFLYAIYQRKKYFNQFMSNRELKNESKADYLNRKADEQRKLNGQSKRW